MSLVETLPLELRAPLQVRSSLVNRRPLVSLVEEAVSNLFPNGEVGAWYDPSDLSTMFQDTNGQTPVTATGQTVGLILDKRLGLQLGPELAPASGAYAGSVSGSWTIPTTSIARNGSSTGQASFTIAAIPTASNIYVVRFTVANLSGDTFAIRVGAGTAYQVTANGTYEARLIGGGGASALLFIPWAGSAGDATITDVSVRQILGNHAYQTTAASRPIFRDIAGVRYLEFDGVDDWLRSTFTIAQPIDRISALRTVAWINQEEFFSGVTSDTVTLYQDATTPDIRMWGGSFSPPFRPAVGVNFVMTEKYAGVSSRGAVNSAAYTEGSWGTEVPGGITIGASHIGSAVASMFIHQLILRGSTTAMTDAQITAARALCTLKAGLVPDAEILKLFAAGQQGAWYDPSDLSTMQTVYNVEGLVTASGQSVGILLDKRLGLAQTANQVTDPDTGSMVPAGTSPPVFTTTTHLGAPCRSVAFNLPAGAGGYAVARADSGATGSVPTGTLRFAAQVSFSRALTGSEILQLFSLSPSDLYSRTFTASNTAAGVGAWLDILAYKPAVAGAAAQFSVYCAGTWPGSAPVTVYIRAVQIGTVLGNHAYQLTSGSRPIYRDLLGLRYLEFDGVDDFLRATFTIAQPLERISALQHVTWTTGDQIFGGSSANFGVLYQDGGTPNLLTYSGAALQLSPSLALGTNGVVTERQNGGSSRIALNSGTYATGNTSTGLPGGITLGGANSGASSNIFLHQLIMRGSTTVFSDEEIAMVRARCQQKSGAAL